MSGISTHVLDTARGRPAAGVTVTLSVQATGGRAWTELAHAATDGDGRITGFLPPQPEIAPGSTCRLRFDVGEYFAAHGVTAFYPYIEITFTLRDDRHHHVPLLVSPFGYSTYRGS